MVTNQVCHRARIGCGRMAIPTSLPVPPGHASDMAWATTTGRPSVARQFLSSSHEPRMSHHQPQADQPLALTGNAPEALHPRRSHQLPGQVRPQHLRAQGQHSRVVGTRQLARASRVLLGAACWDHHDTRASPFVKTLPAVLWRSQVPSFGQAKAEGLHLQTPLSCGLGALLCRHDVRSAMHASDGQGTGWGLRCVSAAPQCSNCTTIQCYMLRCPTCRRPFT